MAYREDVAQAAAALTQGEEANLLLAKLTWENTGRGPGSVSVKQWAADVAAASGRKFGQHTAGVYRRVWEKRLAGDVGDWGDIYDAVRGQTPDERMASFNLRRGIDHATPEVKMQALERLATDPDIVLSARVLSEVIHNNRAAFRAALDEPVVNDVIVDRELDRRREVQRYHEHRIETNPVDRTIDQERAALNLERALLDLVVSVGNVWPHLGALPDPERDALYQRRSLMVSLERAEEVLQKIRTFLSTGKSDIDAFLAEVLQEAPTDG